MSTLNNIEHISAFNVVNQYSSNATLKSELTELISRKAIFLSLKVLSVLNAFL